MTLKRPYRAGALAVALSLFLALFLSVGANSVSFAQTAAAPAAASDKPADAAAPAAAPAAAACAANTDPKQAVTEKCSPNSGDTAWMLTSVALVLMMTIPGLGLFYGGMVRKKNVGDTVMTSFAVTCLVTVIFAVPDLHAGVHARQSVHRRHNATVPARHRQRHRQRRRQSERPRRDDPRNRVHVLPDDVRDHHAGADCRCVRRAHEVLRNAVVHGPVGDLRLRADRAHGVVV